MNEQLRRLEDVIVAAWARPFYRAHWGCGHWEDVLALFREGKASQLPLIRKRDLREQAGQITDFTDAVDVVSSSGTTGGAVDLPVHREEEASRVLRVRRVLAELGVRRGSRVLQLLSLNDMFTLGPLAWQAARELGALVLRCSPQRLERVLQVIAQTHPDFLIGNPFTLARMAQEAGARWPSSARLPDRGFLGVAATFDAALRPTPAAEAAQRLWGLAVTLNQYGCSEVGPIAYECLAHQGLHIHDDHHLVELIDQRTGDPVSGQDQPGEVVLTALTTPRGFLPVRYATGDVAAWLRTGRCACGRSSPRLGPVIGRVDHQLKVLGQTVFPDLLLDIADRCPLVERAAVRVRRDSLAGDEVALLIVAASGADTNRVRHEVTSRMLHHLPVCPSVEVTEAAELDHLEQGATANGNQVKIPRFFDLRDAS